MWRIVLLSAALVNFGGLPASAAAPVLDQTQTAFNGGANVPSNGRIAQTFTAGRSGELARVTLFVGSNDSQTLTVELRDVPAGAPGPTLLAAASRTYAVPGGAHWDDFTFTPAVSVAAGTRYALVLRSEATVPGDGFAWVGSTNAAAYPAGSAWTWNPSSGLWSEQASIRDFAFMTYVAPAPVPTSTVLASSTEPSLAGDAVTFAATVSALAGTTPPAGVVRFTLDGTAMPGCESVGLVPAAGVTSTAACTLALTAGTYAIVAEFAASSAFAGSSGSLTQHVLGARDLLRTLRALAGEVTSPVGTGILRLIDVSSAAFVRGDIQAACGPLHAIERVATVQDGNQLSTPQAGAIVDLARRAADLICP